MNLNLYDKDLNRIAIIGNQYVSCFWSEGYNTVENFTLELIATDEYKQKIKEDYYIGRNDRKTLMIIKTIEIVNDKIIVSGKQAARVLDDVPFIGTIESDSEIDTSIINAYNNSEKYNNLEFADTSLGIKYPHQISNKSFLELCETMCQSEDVGFRTVRNNGVVTLEFYQPTENPNLVFSEKFGNLTIDSILISSENYKNYAVVLGEGEGNERIRVDVDFRNNEKSDTLTWDGDTTGRVMIDAGAFKLCHVSDATPTTEDVANGYKITLSTSDEFYGSLETTQPIDDDAIVLMLSGGFGAFIVFTDNFDLDGLVFERKGTYLVLYENFDGNGTTSWVSSLTINGYTGFGKNKEYRKDLIVDAKDLQIEENETNESYKERLVARGIEKLLEQTKTYSCAFTPYSNDFGSKYDLGDILTIYLTNYGITLKSRVARFTQKAQKNKVETTVEVGQITIIKR